MNAESIINFFQGRKHFDGWWGGIDEDIQQEILAELNTLLTVKPSAEDSEVARETALKIWNDDVLERDDPDDFIHIALPFIATALATTRSAERNACAEMLIAIADIWHEAVVRAHDDDSEDEPLWAAKESVLRSAAELIKIGKDEQSDSPKQNSGNEATGTQRDS